MFMGKHSHRESRAVLRLGRSLSTAVRFVPRYGRATGVMSQKFVREACGSASPRRGRHNCSPGRSEASPGTKEAVEPHPLQLRIRHGLRLDRSLRDLYWTNF